MPKNAQVIFSQGPYGRFLEMPRRVAALPPDARPMLTRATHKDGSKLYAEFAFGIVTDGGRVLGAIATARPAAKP